MLDHVSRRTPPIVKNLRAQNVAAYAPDRGIALFAQPLMAELLGIVIMHFEGTVVDVRGGVCGHEESMVVYRFVAAIYVCEDGDVFCLVLAVARRVVGYVEEVGRREVEVSSIPLHLLVEILHTEAVMSQFMNCGWAGRESVEFPHARFVGFVVVDYLFWQLACGRGRLAVD